MNPTTKERSNGETSDPVFLRLVDSKPAGETVILIFEPPAARSIS